MKYLKLTFLMFIIALIMNITNVYAHPGRTDSNGCHYCRTNCEKWGLSKNEYHCHNSGSNSSNDSISSNSTDTYNEPITIKSNNTNIKRIVIDNKEIEINQTMNYETDRKYINIEVLPAHSKASAQISDYSNLQHGNNKISITITAEDNTKKVYTLNIILKNSDTAIGTLKINNEIITINKKETLIEYETYDKSVNIEATANDKYAQIYYDEQFDLKEGLNETIIQVIAENGDEQEYKIKINKLEKESLESSVIIIIYLAIGAVIGFIIWKNHKKNTITCKKCGNKLNNNVAFCYKCGEKQ